MKKLERLILIYNAKSGLPSAVADSMKKLFKLKACSLCTITHGLLKEKQAWQSCTEELNVPIDYLHKDDMPAPIEKLVAGNLPSILAQIEGNTIILLTPEEIDSCKGEVSNLQIKIKETLKKNGVLF